jgi:uncharacterized protein (TIGR02145 family)
VRSDYAWRVTDVAVLDKVYKIYRCEALYDSLTALIDAVEFARATPPVVDTDSISGLTGTAGVFHAKVTSDGGEAVTAQWFRFGTSSGSLVDSVAVAGTSTPFTGTASSLTSGTTYYVAAFARNAKGTASGDTLSFTTLSAPSVDTNPATAISATAATLNATFTSGGSPVTATGFKYATNAGLTSATNVTGNGTSSPFTGSLTGLASGTQFWAVGYATNAVGTSYGDTITFTTSAAVSPPSVSSVTYDGHTYATVQIGAQWWFAENLRNDNYNDGSVIPGNLGGSAWMNATTDAQSGFEGHVNEAANLATYGRLYNWYAVNTGKLCPTGWHVPTDTEWATLETSLGGASAAGGAMKSSTGWDGSNTSGFSALPAGVRDALGGSFRDLGSEAYWWSSTTATSYSYYTMQVSSSSAASQRSDYVATYGFSVRCIKD